MGIFQYLKIKRAHWEMFKTLASKQKKWLIVTKYIASNLIFGYKMCFSKLDTYKKKPGNIPSKIYHDFFTTEIIEKRFFCPWRSLYLGIDFSSNHCTVPPSPPKIKTSTPITHSNTSPTKILCMQLSDAVILTQGPFEGRIWHHNVHKHVIFTL